MASENETRRILKDFEFYTASGRGYVRSPDFVLFNKNASALRLTISQILAEKLSIQNWEYVVLAINRQNNTLALKRCDIEEIGARRFSHPAGGQSKSVNIKGFVKFFEIKNLARKYKPTKPNQNIVILEPVDDNE